MDTNWSVEAGADDPVIVVPWTDGPPGTADYVEIADEATDQTTTIDSIPEARQWPEVRSALLVLNCADSPVKTVKCDTWVLAEEEKQLDFGPTAFGFGAYFDVVARKLVSSIAVVRQQVEEWSASAARRGPENARADFVVRPAYVSDMACFAVTVYVFGYGQSEAEARGNWAEACEVVARIVVQDKE